ncbi:toxin-antitoxin system YwqK family antitoxin [Ekhidna sp.]
MDENEKEALSEVGKVALAKTAKRPKKKKRRFIWILVLILVFGGGSWLVLKFVSPNSGGPRLNPLNLVPSDAFFILETEEPYSVWSKLAETQIWKTLSKDEDWKAYGSLMEEIEGTLSSFNSILDIIDDRSIFISGHLYHRGSYDYLFVFDMEGVGVLRSWLSSSDNLTKRTFQGFTIYEKLERDSKQTLYFTFIDNYFVGSYTHKLVEQSIAGHQEAKLTRSFDFIEVQKKTIGEGVVRLFLNYETLYPYLVSSLGTEYTEVMKENLPLFHSGFFFDVEESILLLEGYSNYNDTLATYLKIFETSGTGGVDIAKVLPANTSIYFSLGFDRFSEFYDVLDKQLREDPLYGEEYALYTKKTEKFLNIDLKEDVASWIDDEVAVVQIEPEDNSSKIALIIKAKDDDLAKEKMNFLSKQVRKKTPVKFKTVNYKGYEINFMSVKGFFNLLLGKLFNYFDRPYYTVINQYVIFSNEPKVLRQFIDSYLSENTLNQSISYQSFMRQLGEKHSALLYLQLPELVNADVGGMLDEATIKLLQKRRNVIQDFPQIAFSMYPSGDVYQTRALISIDNMLFPELRETEFTVVADTINYDSLLIEVTEEQIDITAIDIELEDLAAKSQTDEYDNGLPKYEVSIKNGQKHGNYFEYFPTGELKIKGKYKNDLMAGTWKYYDEQGNLVKRERYRDGELVD